MVLRRQQMTCSFTEPKATVMEHIGFKHKYFGRIMGSTNENNGRDSPRFPKDTNLFETVPVAVQQIEF